MTVTTVCDLISVQAAATPEAPAVRAGPTVLTYAEVEHGSRVVAGNLLSRRVAPGHQVGVLLDRTTELVVAFLGVLRAGAAYLPLDPYHPAARSAGVLVDSGTEVVVTTSNLAEGLPSGVAPFTMAGLSDTQQDLPSVAPGDLAYVIYTSGSTGRPKGVMVEHRGLVNLSATVAEVFDLGPGSRFLQFASSTFDASVIELILPLTVGATVHMAPRERLASGPDLLRCLRDERITTVILPPSLLAVLDEDGLPDLRTVCSAGETCRVEVARRWARGRRFVNGYGPTEVTVAATFHVGAPGPTDTFVPMGQPVRGASVHVLDASLRPVRPGETGEVYIGGAGVARGYLRRPDLTAEKFLPDPFTPGGRLYRSGDRARLSVGGDLEFVGRTDDQVKLRGYRIELGEIESVLASCPGVLAAAATVHEEATDHRHLAAYVVTIEGGPTPAEVRKHAAHRLPDYMVPPAVLVLDELPLNSNGKVDRSALPHPREMTARGGSGSSAEPSPLEDVIAAMWAKLLGLDAVGTDDNLFDLGADSLLATRFASRVRRELGVDIELPTIFEQPSVSGIASAVLDRLSRDDDQTVAPR
jgi:amino acid adenylation domain-containing protein